MSDKQVAYIAGMGMVTPVGANVEMTAAAVRAGISAYGESDFYGQDDDQPVTMGLVPDEFFAAVEIDIEEGDYYGAQYDRVIKMAVVALREVLSQVIIKNPIPLIMAFPESDSNINSTFSKTLKTNLLSQKDLPLQKEMLHSIYTGRSGGIEAVEIALRYLYDQNHDYVLVGASDSYFQCPRLNYLDETNRLLSPSNSDGFAPGEGAGFFLLTKRHDLAKKINQQIIRIFEPGIGEEQGHLLCEETCRGEGLDKAIKKALSGFRGSPVKSIFSSMNGEKFWSKEYGIAMVRNKIFFHDEVELNHPVDCFGDQGVAIGPVLVGLAATELLENALSSTSLVYSSSDGSGRSALCLEKFIPNSELSSSQI